MASFLSYAEKGKASLGFGDNPVWSGDRKTLFYRSGDDLLEAEIRAGPEIEIGERRLLLKHRIRSREAVRWGCRRTEIPPQWNPVRQDQPDVNSLMLVINWLELLKKR